MQVIDVKLEERISKLMLKNYVSKTLKSRELYEKVVKHPKPAGTVHHAGTYATNLVAVLADYALVRCLVGHRSIYESANTNWSYLTSREQALQLMGSSAGQLVIEASRQCTSQGKTRKCTRGILIQVVKVVERENYTFVVELREFST